MKKLILLLFVLSCCFFAFGQNPKMDNWGIMETGVFHKIEITIDLCLLIILSFFSFLFLKNRPDQIPISDENKSLDQTKIEQYFEELFARLEENQSALQSATPPPIHDMTEFLKTNLSTPNDWSSFEYYFKKVHKDFFKKLKSSCPSITSHELNMCALLKLNLQNKDIAQIIGISPGSVRKAQNRLTKKLELSPDEVLRDFILMQ